jgi:allophanate hydrolase
MEEMQPPRPGMLRVEDGAAIEVEVWELPRACFGAFIAQVPSPLSIGMVELETGEQVHGFLCESYTLKQAKDISHLGG